jgi:hypothetical protein
VTMQVAGQSKNSTQEKKCWNQKSNRMKLKSGIDFCFC